MDFALFMHCCVVAMSGKCVNYFDVRNDLTVAMLSSVHSIQSRHHFSPRDCIGAAILFFVRDNPGWVLRGSRLTKT
jgi:hypothetical protein